MVLIFISQYLSCVTVHIDLTFDSLYHSHPLLSSISTHEPTETEEKERRHANCVVALKLWNTESQTPRNRQNAKHEGDDGEIQDPEDGVAEANAEAYPAQDVTHPGAALQLTENTSVFSDLLAGGKGKDEAQKGQTG